MKKISSIGVLLTLLSGISYGQQPFEKYDYKVTIATLSKGKYIEFFDSDTLTQIGSVIINRLTGRIVSLVEYDTLYSEATLEPEIISRWLSPDPLADEFESLSPYNFVNNNPIRYIDPTGAYFVDYYDQGGSRIGTDGNDDGRVVVVTNKDEVKQIKRTNKQGGTTSLDQVNSGIELPSASIRSTMGNAVDRSNNPSGDDTQGGFHEEGGIFGLDANGNEVVNDADPGSVSDPSVENAEATVNVFSGDDGTIVNVQGTFHVHPRGTVTERPGANTIGGTIRTSSFVQTPSDRDINNQGANQQSGAVTGNSYVLGARSGKVSIYNGNGTVATFPLRKFRRIGN